MRIEDEWRNAATITCKSPLDIKTRRRVIAALMRKESVIIDDTVLVKFQDPLGDEFIFGENQLRYGFVAGETFDQKGCANAVEWAEAQQDNPET